MGKDIFLVGFAAESEDLLKNARKKLLEKKLDIVIANLIKESMGKPFAKVTIVDKTKEVVLQSDKKINLSIAILKHIFKIYTKEDKNELIN